MMNFIEKIKMSREMKKASTALTTITWKWIDSDEIHISQATSNAIASLMADPCIEILD